MKKINSEEPSEHWRFMDVKDKVVLDLGCGIFYSKISTSEWFVNEGAKHVVGVDMTAMDVNSEKFSMVVQKIDSTEQLQILIDEIQPNVIKCDIEGAEKYMDKVKMPDKLERFSVEYHDHVTKNICEKAIASWGFKNIEHYQLLGEDINRIGVIDSWK